MIRRDNLRSRFLLFGISAIVLQISVFGLQKTGIGIVVCIIVGAGSSE